MLNAVWIVNLSHRYHLYHHPPHHHHHHHHHNHSDKHGGCVASSTASYSGVPGFQSRSVPPPPPNSCYSRIFLPPKTHAATEVKNVTRYILSDSQIFCHVTPYDFLQIVNLLLNKIRITRDMSIVVMRAYAIFGEYKILKDEANYTSQWSNWSLIR
jgi:hypothetical protein